MAAVGRISGYAGHIPKSWDPEDPKSARSARAPLRTSTTLAGAGSRLTAGPPTGRSQQMALSVPIELLLDGLRSRLKKHGARGIAGIGRKFRILDDSGNKRLSCEEFTKGLHELNLACTQQECDTLFQYFDRDGSGSVDYEEFLGKVRGAMNPRRKGFVQMAFQKLDRTGDGVVNKDDLINAFDPNGHPSVQIGHRSAQDVHSEFLDTFDVGDHNGQVTLQEFIQYYDGVSASVDDDSYFELMIRNAWHLTGGVGQSANTANLRVLVTYKNGSQKVECVNDDFGLDLHAPGAANDVIRRLERQGLTDIAKVDWSGMC